MPILWGFLFLNLAFGDKDRKKALEATKEKLEKVSSELDSLR